MKLLRDALIDRQTPTPAALRMRGVDVSRLEALTDAVFALALTMLAVSLEVPTSFAELMLALQGFGSFAACFATLMLIWYAHYSFFRQYALNDGVVLLLNSVLLFVVLFYIYPLKFLFSYLIDRLLLYGVLGLEVGVPVQVAYAEMSQLLLIYSAGFLMVFLIMALLNVQARRKRVELELTDAELWDNRANIESYLLCVAVAVVSLGLAATGDRALIPMAGWIYVLLGPLQGLHGIRRRRQPAAARSPSDTSAELP